MDSWWIHFKVILVCRWSKSYIQVFFITEMLKVLWNMNPVDSIIIKHQTDHVTGA